MCCVDRLNSQARERYIEDNEYFTLLNQATPPVKIAIELSYLCGARQGDILKLKWSDITKKGIFIRQSKTGKSQIKLLNDDLKRVLKSAKKLPGIASAVYVVSTRSGSRYTSSGFRAVWKRAKAKAGINVVTFHDIKAKSISDYEGDKQYFSGHNSYTQMSKYNRSPDKVKSLIEPKVEPKKKKVSKP